MKLYNKPMRQIFIISVHVNLARLEDIYIQWFGVRQDGAGLCKQYRDDGKSEGREEPSLRG